MEMEGGFNLGAYIYIRYVSNSVLTIAENNKEKYAK